MNLRFSVIICTFNAESTLERTLLSVSGQDYPLIETVIIDGASTDGTMEIVRRSAPEGATVVSARDRGLYDAMNKGLRLVCGEYVIFLNSGDRFHSNSTLSSVAAGLSGEPDIIYGQTALVDADGKFLGMRRLHAPNQLDWRSFRSGMLVCHQAFWVRREIAVGTQYDLSFRFSSDVDWCIRVMKKSEKIFNTRQTLIDYLSTGLTTQNRLTSLRERFRVMSRHYGLVPTMFRHVRFVFRSIFKNL